MPDDAHADLLELAKEIAIEAGEAVLEVYDKGEFDAYQKDDESPVTSADYLATISSTSAYKSQRLISQSSQRKTNTQV